jgi:type I restriction enzyme R subunit
VDRFKALADDEPRAEFRDKLSAYLKLYAFLSQIIPYADPELEMLYSYGRCLMPHLPTGRDGEIIQVDEDVAL